MTDRGRYRSVLGAAVQVHAVSTRLDASGSVRTLTPHIFNLVTVNRRGVLLLRPFLSVVVSETQGLILSSVLPGRLGATPAAMQSKELVSVKLEHSQLMK